jgi:rubrerythrin
MNTYVCNICGEVYIGETSLSTCPFCGAHNQFLYARDWKDKSDVGLTEKSRANLEQALELEISNTGFYRCCYETLSNQEVGLVFKGLFKVEREHASIFRKILRPEKDPQVSVHCEDDIMKCVNESYEREQKAINFYAQALHDATEPRVREVFGAIMNVEKDHLALDQIIREKFKG